MKINFFYSTRFYETYKSEFDSAFQRVMESGQYVLGNEVSKFEAEFSDYCGVKYAVSCGNGLDAIYLALRGFGVGPGDEVIVPSNTYIATWIAVSRTGATVVPCEPNFETYNIDPTELRKKITEKTRAIIPVDLYGQPAAMDEISEIAEKYEAVKIIVDAAQSHGARYKGRKTGAFGNATAFSFYPTKNLGAIGDGGCVTTDDEDLAAAVRILRNYGSSQKYVNKKIGINSRLDELQAAFLRVKLARLDELNLKRAKIARRYLGEICDDHLTLPYVPEGISPSWHLFVVRHSSRKAVQAKLAENFIETIVHYPIPPHLQEAYGYLGFKQGDFPVSEKIAAEVFSIPIDPFMDMNEVSYVIDNLNQASREY